jgi:ABC-type branched-subunit amino acid transport system ATPase component
MLSKIGYALTVLREDEDADLGAANYVYTMHKGMIKTEENSEEIKNSSDIREAYLGI